MRLDSFDRKLLVFIDKCTGNSMSRLVLLRELRELINHEFMARGRPKK
jgi:hypothetical protein